MDGEVGAPSAKESAKAGSRTGGGKKDSEKNTAEEKGHPCQLAVSLRRSSVLSSRHSTFAGFFPCSRQPSIIRYNTGIKKRFSTVDMIMPPKTVVPTE